MTTYSPQLGDLYLMIAICGFLFVTLVFLAFRLGKMKHPDPRRRVLLPMLCYFMALLALMGLLGSFWSAFKYPSVSIEPEAIVLNGESYPRPRQGDMRMESYTGSGFSSTTRVLLIQTRDRRTWAFPADRYPINEMMNKLRE